MVPKIKLMCKKGGDVFIIDPYRSTEFIRAWELEKVCILGLGQVGLPTAKYILEKGFETWGYDLSKESVNRANDINATTNWDDIPHDEIAVYVICVSTKINGTQPDMSAIFDVSRKVASVAQNKPLVSVESTVCVGTCIEIYNNIFKKSVNLVHVPHRYWKEDPIRYGIRQVRVIGGVDEESLKRGLDFYRRLDIPLHPVSKIEIAEMSKIVENSYRFVQIAFAEELKMICDKNGLDFEELRRACNTKWNVEILEARDGIGGHLPKDLRYLLFYSKYYNGILYSAMRVDEVYRTYKLKSEI